MNSGFIGKLTCSECDSSVTEGISLPNDEKYYDKYEYNTSDTTYNRGKLGDATKEMGPFQTIIYGSQTRYINSWYNDFALINNSNFPWFVRGGDFYDGNETGLSSFYGNYGCVYSNVSFRLVLAF